MPIGTPVGGTAATSATAVTTINVAYPASVTAGQLLILRVTLQTTSTMTTPSGWTAQASPSSSGTTTPRVWLFTKVAAGTETGSLTITFPSAIVAARIYSFSGVDTTTPMDVAGTTLSAGAITAYTLPGVTTVTDGAMLWVSAGCNAATGSFTPATSPGTFTEILDSPTAVHSMDAYLALGTAGATGTVQTFTRSAALRGAAAMLALRPASTGTVYSVTGTAAATSGASGSVTRVPRIYDVTGTAAAVSGASGNASIYSPPHDLVATPLPDRFTVRALPAALSARAVDDRFSVRVMAPRFAAVASAPRYTVRSLP